MAKKKTNRKGMGFALFMAFYAIAFLTAAFFGLKWFWGYMEGYEASRPHIAIDAYMAKLDKEYIISHSNEFMSTVDFNIQDQETCRNIVLEALEGEISYARKASECTEDRQVYVVRCGKTVVGSFTIETTAEDEYGFKPWTLREEQYDLSWLMGTETVTVSAPEGYSVYVNGVKLDESYIISSEATDYEVYGDLYESYDLPRFTLNTYKAGPFLGLTCQAEVYDPAGKPFVYDESFDPYSLLPRLETGKEQELEDFLEEFLEAYVIFAGCANDARHANYQKVMKYVVADSNLAQRMYDALDGYQFAQSQGDEIAGITIHHLLPLEEGKYLCDVTYLVDTKGYDGVVQTSTSCRITIVESNGKYLVESKIIY